MKHASLLLTALTLVCAAPTLACDISMPPELEFSSPGIKPMKVKDWNGRYFTQKSMIDGKLLYRHIKHRGLPSGATETKLLNEHAARAMTAAYGGKPAGITILSSRTERLLGANAGPQGKVYEVALKLAGDPTPRHAGVIIRDNPGRKDIAMIVAAIDPDSPDGDLQRPLAVARSLAAHPGFECGPGDGP